MERWPAYSGAAPLSATGPPSKPTEGAVLTDCRRRTRERPRVVTGSWVRRQQPPPLAFTSSKCTCGRADPFERSRRSPNGPRRVYRLPLQCYTCNSSRADAEIPHPSGGPRPAVMRELAPVETTKERKLIVILEGATSRVYSRLTHGRADAVGCRGDERQWGGTRRATGSPGVLRAHGVSSSKDPPSNGWSTGPLSVNRSERGGRHHPRSTRDYADRAAGGRIAAPRAPPEIDGRPCCE